MGQHRDRAWKIVWQCPFLSYPHHLRLRTWLYHQNEDRHWAWLRSWQSCTPTPSSSLLQSSLAYSSYLPVTFCWNPRWPITHRNEGLGSPGTLPVDVSLGMAQANAYGREMGSVQWIPLQGKHWHPLGYVRLDHVGVVLSKICYYGPDTEP